MTAYTVVSIRPPTWRGMPSLFLSQVVASAVAKEEILHLLKCRSTSFSSVRRQIADRSPQRAVHTVAENPSTGQFFKPPDNPLVPLKTESVVLPKDGGGK
jgi:hypothetical protein